MMARRRRKQNAWKGLVLGALGGVAGVLAMRYYWQLVEMATGRDPRRDYDQSDVPDTEALKDVSLVGTQHRQGESSTAAMGRLAYRTITGKEPQSDEMKNALSYLVHWGVSMGASAVYGALRGHQRDIDLAGGIALGTALWLFGDEFAMPVLGFTKGPTAYPPDLHLHGFLAHIAYGTACAVATQELFRLSK